MAKESSFEMCIMAQLQTVSNIAQYHNGLFISLYFH